MDEFETVARRPRPAAEHADDQARIERGQFVERLRSIVSDLEEPGPLGLGEAGQAANDGVVDEGRNQFRLETASTFGLKTSRKYEKPLAMASSRNSRNASSEAWSASRSLVKVIE